ncbi:MAG: radical SAM protein [Chloroflexi bacterium]|nr:radical SAM protein [Chloroflexota bacterium]MCL5026421.1 radical SAM protein [Chloroflexota bacterium]
MASALPVALGHAKESLLQNVALRSGWEIAKPTTVGLLITYRCQMRCKQCDIWTWSDRRDELSTEQWKAILRDLRRWLGPCHVQFGGGEPFLRQDLVELFSYASSLGIVPGTTTNAIAISSAKTRELMDCGLFNMNVSMDAIQPDKYEYLRGVPGAFGKLMSTIEELKARQRESNSRLRIIVKTTIMGYNLDQIVPLLDWVEQQGLLGIRLQLLDQNLGEERDPHWYQKSDLWVKEPAALDAVIDAILERKGRGAPVLNTEAYLHLARQYYRDPSSIGIVGGRCAVGWSAFNVNANGDVQLCYDMPSIGNLTRSTAAEIWHSPQARERRAQIARCRQSCIQLCRVQRSLAENVELFCRLVGIKGKGGKGAA